MRHAARTDANQAAIVSALRAAGASVWNIKLPVDLLVGVAGRTALVEVKTDKGKHTPLQQSFMADWRGGTVATIRDVDAALRLVATMKGTA